MWKKLQRSVVWCGGSLAVVFVCASAYADTGNLLAEKITNLEKMFAHMQASNQDLAAKVTRLEKENQALRQDLNQKISAQEKTITRFEGTLHEATRADAHVPEISRGIEIGFGATNVIHGILTGGNDTNDPDDEINGTWTADLELTKQFDNGGFGYAHIEMGEGAGLDGQEINTFSAMNRDAGNSNTNL